MKPGAERDSTGADRAAAEVAIGRIASILVELPFVEQMNVLASLVAATLSIGLSPAGDDFALVLHADQVRRVLSHSRRLRGSSAAPGCPQ